MDATSTVATLGTAALLASAIDTRGIVTEEPLRGQLQAKPSEEPEYPEYDIVNPDGSVEKAEQGGVQYPEVKRNKKGYIVEPRRMVPFREAPKKSKPVVYQRIPMCGHKFIPMEEPRHKGCESCWFTFFQVHGELTQSVEKVYQEQGADFLAKLKGRAYVTNFLKFMSTVAAFQKAVSAAQAGQENNGITSTGGTDGANEGEDNDPDAARSRHTLETGDYTQAGLFESEDGL